MIYSELPTRIVSINHNDLDGLAAALAVAKAHGVESKRTQSLTHIITLFCDYENVNETLLLHMKAKPMPARIVMADICLEPANPDPDYVYKSEYKKRLLTEDLPREISKYVEAGGELVILDHHGSRVKQVFSQYGHLLHPLSIGESVDSSGTKRAGSELAYRYYAAINPLSEESTIREQAEHYALGDFCRLAGAYDTWRPEKAGLGSALAMGLSVMNDRMGGFQDMSTVIRKAANFLLNKPVGYTLTESDWGRILSATQTGLAFYANAAAEMFEDEVGRARAGMIQHHPKVTEIHSDFFESLVADDIYTETGGLVMIRYEEDRTRARRYSLRGNVKLGVDLGAVAEKLVGRDNGGGHAEAAGVRLQAGQTADDVVDALITAVVVAESNQ